MNSETSYTYLKALLSVVLLLVLFGTSAAGSEKKDIGLSQLPTPSELSALSILSPTQDTILYDNNTALHLDTTTGHWVGVRFTTVAPFELEAIYFATLNQYNNTTDGCSLYVVDCDSLGFPDWPNGILASLWVPPPLSDMTWMQVDLDSAIQFITIDHFYIIYGPAPSGPYPGTGWWSAYDSDSSTSQRTHVSYDDRESWTTVTFADAFVRAGGEYTVEFVSDELFAYFTPGTDSFTIDSINQAIGCELLERFAFELEDTTIEAYFLRIVSGLSVPRAVETYKNSPNVFFAEPNFIMQTDQRVLNNAERWPVPADDTFNPAMPEYGRQWSLDNWGQALPFFGGVNGTVDADIDAPQMWRMLTQAHPILAVVAILDSGVDWDHPDLAANIWLNLLDLPDGVDNDANGYIDDFRGWDCVNDNNDPDDDFGHGTHVAGIVGAQGGNGDGVCGVAWTAQLMVVKVTNATGGGSFDDAVEGIVYAVGKLARIINMSLGSPAYDMTLHAAILWAQRNDRLIVASAGNRDRDIDRVNPVTGRLDQTRYPASFSNPAAIPPLGWHRPGVPIHNPLPAAQNIIGVAASDQNDARARFRSPPLAGIGSNWGATSVHLAAPGECIYSTMPAGAVTMNWHPDFNPNPCTGVNFALNYDFMSGTSMAAPHVSGAAALCWTLEMLAGNLPTASQLKDLLSYDPESFNAADKEAKPAFRLGGVGEVVTEGRLRAPHNADFGDAPDPPYLTRWPPLNTGALHLDCGLEWLGNDISVETGANDLILDTDGRPNLDDDDGFDDWVTFFPPYFCKGGLDRVDVVVTVSNPLSGRYGGAFPGGRFLYLSSFFDFNNNGTWLDVSTCMTANDAPEHLLIQAVGGPGAPSVVGVVPPPDGRHGSVVVIDPSLWGGAATQQSKRFELYFYSPHWVADTIWSRFRVEYNDKIWPDPDNKFLGTERDYSLFGEVEDWVLPNKPSCYVMWDSDTAVYFFADWSVGDQQAIYYDPSTMCTECAPDVYPFLITQVEGVFYDFAGAGFVEVIFHFYEAGTDICYGPGAEIYSFSDTITTFYPYVATAALPATFCTEGDFFLAVEYSSGDPGSIPCVMMTDQLYDTCTQFNYQDTSWYEWSDFWSSPPPGYLMLRASGICNSSACPGTTVYLCGDCNEDSVIDVGDVVCEINYLYRGYPPPYRECMLDANCDGVANVGDVVHLLNYLYRGDDPPCQQCCFLKAQMEELPGQKIRGSFPETRRAPRRIPQAPGDLMRME